MLSAEAARQSTAITGRLLCFEQLPFIDEFFHALRVRFRGIGESLIITGLATGIRPRVFRFVLLAHATTEARYPPKDAWILLCRRSLDR